MESHRTRRIGPMRPADEEPPHRAFRLCASVGVRAESLQAAAESESS